MIKFKTLRPRLGDKSLKFLAWFFSLQSLPGQNSCFVSSSSNVTKHFYLTTGSLNSLKEKMWKKVEDAYNSWVFYFWLNKPKFINESGRALWQATFKNFSGNSCVPVNEGSVLGFVGTKREKPSFIKNWKLCQFGRRPGSQWVKIWCSFCFIHCWFPCLLLALLQ